MAKSDCECGLQPLIWSMAIEPEEHTGKSDAPQPQPRVSDIYSLVNSVKSSEEVELNVLSDMKELAEQFRTIGPKYGERLLQTEFTCLKFVIQRDGLHPQAIYYDKKGNKISSPDISKLSKCELRYIEARLPNISSPLVRIRSHLILLERNKHNKHAKDAIEELKQLTVNELGKTREERFRDNFRISNMAALLLGITKKRLPDRFDEIMDHYWVIVEGVVPEQNSPFREKYDLLKFLVERRNEIREVDRARLIDECEKLHGEAVALSNTAWEEHAIELNIRLHQLLEIDPSNWKRKLAECYENMIDSRGGQPNMVAYQYCVKSIEAYRELPDETKLNELIEKFEKIKSGIKHNGIAIPIDNYQEIRDSNQEQIKSFSQFRQHELLNMLMHYKDLLPQKTELLKNDTEIAMDTPLLALTGRKVLDESRNLAKQTDWGAENTAQARLYENYDFQMQLFHLPIIHGIIVEAIESGRLTFEGFRTFIDSRCWYAQPNSLNILPLDVREYDWRGQVLAVIGEYFTSLELAQRNPFFHPNFQLCIDSLVTKMEGILRSFAKVMSINTTKIRKRDGQTITESVDINDLLYEPKLTELFGEDTMLYLRWLLVEKFGLNLRHNVCHGLMRGHNYSIIQMHMLFIALLRISTYGLNAKS